MSGNDIKNDFINLQQARDRQQREAENREETYRIQREQRAKYGGHAYYDGGDDFRYPKDQSSGGGCNIL